MSWVCIPAASTKGCNSASVGGSSYWYGGCSFPPSSHVPSSNAAKECACKCSMNRTAPSCRFTKFLRWAGEDRTVLLVTWLPAGSVKLIDQPVWVVVVGLVIVKAPT